MSLDLNLKVRTSKKVYCFLNATSYDILLQCAKLNRKRCIRTSEVGSRILVFHEWCILDLSRIEHVFLFNYVA